jgi:hypothetical protein
VRTNRKRMPKAFSRVKKTKTGRWHF